MRLGISNTAAVLGFLGAAIGGLWLAAGGAEPFAFADDPVKPKDASAEKKTEHLTVAGLRDRLMTEFHGRTTNVFTSVPGFGMERMIPVYERIPWEVPHFSTEDIEVEVDPTTPQLLKDAFAKSLEAFRNPTPVKAAPADSVPPTPKVGPRFSLKGMQSGQPGFGGERDGTIVSGVQLRLLDLLSTLDPDHPVIFSGGKAFELVRAKRGLAATSPEDVKRHEPQKAAPKEINGHFGDLEERPLDLFEVAALTELSSGKDTFIRTKDNVVRLMGALRATDRCIECHTDHHKGELLGALSYTFLDTNGSLKTGDVKEKR